MELNYEKPEEALYYLKKERERRENFFWKDKNGNLHNIKEMSDSYLNNVINFLEQFIYEMEIVNENYVDAFDYD